jgi:hypothetical protein
MLNTPSDRTTKHLTRLTNYISQVIANPALLGTLSRQRARGELSPPSSFASAREKLTHVIPPLPLAGEGWGEGQ